MSQRQRPQFAYFRGEIVPFDEATVSISTHALQYGTAVFGGLRGYWNEEIGQMFLFRPLDHFERLHQSASLIRMNIFKSPQELTEILIELLQREGYRENCYIRPFAYKSAELVMVSLHDVPDDLAIYAFPFGQYVANEEGLHVCFSAWQRVNDNAIPARAKISGAYVNSALIKSDAKLAGYDEALVLTQDGHVSEASAANIFMVRNGIVYTPPVSSDLLEGIVRRSIMQLAQDELGLEVIEREIDRTEIYIADEVFICGTGVQVAAVTRIEHRDIGSSEMGTVTRQLRDMFFDVVNGRVPKYRHWLSPVYVKELV